MPLKTLKHTFRGKVWKYNGPSAWHFITLPRGLSREIKRFAFGEASPWGSIRITATVGRTSWKTSVFPDEKTGAFLLPVKAEVRRAEGLNDAAVVDVAIDVRLP